MSIFHISLTEFEQYVNDELVWTPYIAQDKTQDQ